MTRRAVAGAIASVTIALALPGSAWAQPGSGDAPVTVMPLPASPLLVEAAAFTPAQLDIPSIGVTAAVAPVGTVMAPAPFLGGKMVPTFAVPPDGSSVGWWADGPLVGAPGMAIILGHNKVGGGTRSSIGSVSCTPVTKSQLPTAPGAPEPISASPGLCLVSRRTTLKRCGGCCPTTPKARNWR